MPQGAGYADMTGTSQGKIAMMINGPWSWDNLRKSKINFGVAKIPAVSGNIGNYFSRERFANVDGVLIDEVALNPEYFAASTIVSVLSTLVHEQTHQLQSRFGTPSRAAPQHRMGRDDAEHWVIPNQYRAAAVGKRVIM